MTTDGWFYYEKNAKGEWSPALCLDMHPSRKNTKDFQNKLEGGRISSVEEVTFAEVKPEGGIPTLQQLHDMYSYLIPTNPEER